MLPGTIVAAIVMAPAFWNARLPLAPVKANAAPGRLFAWVDRSMLPPELKELPVAAVRTPLSMILPIAVPVSVPPTVDAPKFKLDDSTAALPGLLSTIAPVKRLLFVERSMVLAEVKLLALASVSTPLSIRLPPAEVDEAVSTPPTLEVPRFKLAELIDAVPVPVVFSETGPVKLLACVARSMFWLAVWAVKLPPPAVIAPVSMIPPVAAVPLSVPPTVDVPRFNAAASMLAVPVPLVLSKTGPVKLLA